MLFRRQGSLLRQEILMILSCQALKNTGFSQLGETALY